jgi:hypothetical protein
MDSLLLTRVFFLNHGEESKSHIQSTDLKIHLSSGSIRDLLLRRSINTTINTTIKLKTLVTMVLLRKFMDLLQLTRAFYHNHGDVLRRLIQSMDSRTHLSNGLTKSDMSRMKRY